MTHSNGEPSSMLFVLFCSAHIWLLEYTHRRHQVLSLNEPRFYTITDIARTKDGNVNMDIAVERVQVDSLSGYVHMCLFYFTRMLCLYACIHVWRYFGWRPFHSDRLLMEHSNISFSDLSPDSLS